MGLLKHLLFWPVTGPTFLARFSLEKLQGVVRDEATDDTRIKEALLDLQLRLELEEIDEEAYVREEARLLEELREIRRLREELGMGTRGGVVRMAGEPAARPDDAGNAPPAAAPPQATLEVTLDWETPDEGEER